MNYTAETYSNINLALFYGGGFCSGVSIGVGAGISTVITGGAMGGKGSVSFFTIEKT